ncbi:MAG TPA: ribonuclease HII [archaeon]|nr:ribonuclease HII [archaeon]
MTKCISSQYIAGIDEAGRGCVLGPLVISVCVIPEDKQEYFRQIGVKDSKLLTKKQREFLFDRIINESVEYKIIVIPAEELNVLMKEYSLNEIEAQKAAELLFSLKTDVSLVYVDSPDVTQERFKKRILDNLKLIGGNPKKYNIISEHKADFNYPVVGCASILSKVTRDSWIKKLTGKDISGYSSDPKTISFLKDYIIKYKKLPEYARTEWKTIDNIMSELYQKKIGWFNEDGKTK